MLLSSALAPAVSQAIRQLGETYFRENGVEIIQGEQDFVEAYVQGMDERNAVNVLMERQGDNLFASCSCSYAQKRLRPCKHIWATILAAEARRYLGEASSHDRPKLITMHDLDDLDDDPADADDDWEDSWEDEDEAEFDPPQRRPASQAIYPSASFAQRPPALSPAADSNWKNELRAVQQRLGTTPYTRPSTWPENREILYVLTLPTELLADTITINVACRTRKKNGDWGRIQFPSLDRRVIPLLPDTRDRALLGTLSSIQQAGPYYDPYSASSTLITTSLSEPLLSELLPQLCETGRCCLHHSLAGDDYSALSWDAGPAWEFRVDVAVEPAGSHYVVAGQLQRGTECRPLTAARALLRRFVFWDDGVARLTEHSDAAWMELLRRKTLRVPRKQANNFIKELVKVPRLPPLQLPDELHLEQVQGSPRFALKIRAPGKGFALSYLSADLSFEYEGKAIARGAMEAGVLDEKGRRLVLRDGAAEEEAVQRLQDLGFRPIDYYSAWAFQLPPRKLPSVVHTLLQAGWHVEAEGKLYRRAGEIKIDVTSGIDWFELHGSVAFGDAVAQLPELLAALRRGENTVQLGDGSFGVLPEEWLKKYGVLAGLGTVKDNHLEFKRSQVGLLDALLAAQPEATFDAAFSRARDELATFSRIDATDPPTGFIGQLRAYQREGLGWLHFLRRFGFGGCLADDMGLGKTIQVLALLEERRRLRAAANGERVPPSLVVVPRSLVFNWKQEAARFTPGLRVLDYTLAGRTASTDGFDQYDLVLTTYGTLRKDVPHLKDYRFDYCILDESQAVKNPNTESAKAVRLLQANQRLALSGTPIENHLGELWSLFEYLNPGMLGAASVFRLLGVNARAPAPEARELLARALRPFILRRTKAQVARDLPEKLEQTIFCELEPVQRRLYNELRDHFRATLQKRIEREGINKAKIHVLEALLRLRQAACHPGLIDQQRTGEASAKLDTLLLQLDEVAEAGHKALVFSQFTSFLAIVRARLDKHKVVYEYLDGQTRDRERHVKRFQEDPACKLFLISLKAGGLGLNLTAAEYVFLLDPWWNPAVEAQAIDRTHRIGQTREVFAYRLIARDTVEEKVLELQQSKRDLADAIINADNSLIGSLTREDLELLLS